MLNSGGIAINEDCSHFFYERVGKDVDVTDVEAWVDGYAGTQVKYLMLNPNAMRTSYASDVWEPFWKGRDPNANDGGWDLVAMQLHQKGIDVYELWIDRARQKGISPWISMRMNDVHNVDDEQNPGHSTFWREHPEFRRINWRMASWMDRAFDYGKPEVREYNMKLIRELVERYDFDGLELDWMRFGYHFAPGGEDVSILNEFTSDVRRLLDEWEQKRGHRIGLAARVPPSPQTGRALGMDGVEWARRGLIDILTVTPFFATLDTDMPIELWKQLLDGADVLLAAGLEIILSPYPGYSVQTADSKHLNSLETVRGAAASALDRGADFIYLFNYMDGEAIGDDSRNYPHLIRELGSLNTMADKTRRHVVTYADTWAVGEPHAVALPAICRENEWQEFRVHIGPKPPSGEAFLVLGIESGNVERDTISVRLNSEVVAFQGPIELPMPHPDFPTYGFVVPLSALNRGYNVIMLTSTTEIKIGWVEILIRPL